MRGRAERPAALTGDKTGRAGYHGGRGVGEAIADPRGSEESPSSAGQGAG